MKLLIEVDLNDFDEKKKAERLLSADDCYAALWEMAEQLRKVIKYSDNAREVAYTEKVSEKFYEILTEHNITILI